MNEIKVEKGVEIPPMKAHNKYPWDRLEVGDSFFVTLTNRNEHSLRSSLAACANNRSRRGNKFIVRKVDGGFRVWRTE